MASESNQSSLHSVEKPLPHYRDLEYRCRDCGRVECFDGLAIEVRCPIRPDANCGICYMNLVDDEYQNGEKEPYKEVSYV